MRTVTHLFFDGTCREAFGFYQSCLGGKTTFNPVGELPPEVRKGMPVKDVPDAKLIHASLEKDGLPLLFGSDMMDPSSFVKGDSFSVVLDCSSEKEINDAYKRLSAGGKMTMELADAFWGAKFASFTDKFGVDWQLNWWKPKKEAKE